VRFARIALTTVFSAIVAGRASAQSQTASSLQARVDASTYAVLRTLIDSARKAKLPAKLIEDNALEGAVAGVPGDSVIRGVRAFVRQLGIAQATLGTSAFPGELRAAVSAIDAGVPLGDLKRIRRAAPKRSIAAALAVLSDIANRGVPIPTSGDLIVSLLNHNVKDADLIAFSRWVRQDIEKGGNPSAAATARANGIITAAGGRGSLMAP
jgi:hypothetical protein